MEMLLTGNPIDVATALDWGLVNRVVPASGSTPTSTSWPRRYSPDPSL
jgi:enoyl-CoA hydratase/carnithine racemase